MKKNKLFLILSILFILIMLAFTFHMSTHTVKPWEKSDINKKGQGVKVDE